MAAAITRPRIALIATGGTIAGAAPDPANAGAYRAAVAGVDTLLAALPALAEVAEVRAEQLFQIDSSDLDDAHLLALARRAAQRLAEPEVDGLVITHGTDTLEESAYFLHLVLKTAKPVLLVGAMRPANALGADGPPNLLQALAVAADPLAAGQGVLVLMDGLIHSARDVAKTHATALHAFASPWGPLGAVVGLQPRWYRAPCRPHTLASEFDIADLAHLAALPRVALLACHAGIDGSACAAIAAGAQGLVVAGLGAGTLPARLVAPLAELAQRGVLVVRASRTGAGPLQRNAGGDDDRHGWLVVDDQSPAKARLLVALALTRSADRAAIQRLLLRY